MLRSRARKSGTQTSNFRGVSLLKQTKKWHAQINVSGKQVHLGFFPTEEQAARAYDRAAINKGARESTKVITNFHIREYEHELDILCSITQQEIVDALASESCASSKGLLERCRLRLSSFEVLCCLCAKHPLSCAHSINYDVSTGLDTVLNLRVRYTIHPSDLMGFQSSLGTWRNVFCTS